MDAAVVVLIFFSLVVVALFALSIFSSFAIASFDAVSKMGWVDTFDGKINVTCQDTPACVGLLQLLFGADIVFVEQEK